MEATPTGQLTINKNAIDTNVLVDNGETVVLGGILKKPVITQTKAPFLGDIPLSWKIIPKRFESRKINKNYLFCDPEN